MNDSPWRIIVFSNLAALAPAIEPMISSFGHRLVGIVTTPGPPKNRSEDYLEVVKHARPGVEVIVSTRPRAWAQMIAPLKPDLIISIGFPWLIPDDVLSVPRLGGINFHMSSLPKYRGPHPIGWTFRNGDPELGMTIHRLDNQFDTGHILATGTIPIGDDDSIDSLGEQIGSLSFEQLGRALQRLANGEPGDPQPVDGASEAPFFEPEWRCIDWNNTARTIHNQVRSWTGDRAIPKGAYGNIDGAPVLITKTRLLAGETGQAAIPGTVIQRDADGMIVQCGDGQLQVVHYSTE
jgi:methionyl-tRNA formyltransferase